MKKLLIKKLLLFTIPISTIPLLILVAFTYMYLLKIIENEVVYTNTKIIKYVVKDVRELIDNVHLLEAHIHKDHISLQELTILDENINVVFQNFDAKNLETSNIVYDKERLLKYVRENKGLKDVLNYKIDQTLIKPLYENKKIVAYVASHYKNTIENKLISVRQTFAYMFFILVFIIFIISISLLIFSMKLLNPLRELIEGVENVSSGNLSYRIKNSSSDEIGILVNSFNQMTVKLKNSENELKELNSNLELQVQTKTQELQLLNHSLEDKVTQATKEVKEQGLLLIQQSRLAQMGELVSMIAHQWRQPLSAISSISSTLSLDIIMGAYKKEFFQERLESISELSQHLSTTIDDFRNFFKINKEKEDSEAQNILSDSIKIIKPTITSSNIKIELLMQENPIFVETYVNEVKQVILNIIKNAEDALIECEEVNPTIWIRCFKDENFVIYEIEDNAGGVPKNVLPKIFNPYFSTKNKKDGTGLGLYMSKTIIEKHCEGILSVINTYRGAKFTIKLPI